MIQKMPYKRVLLKISGEALSSPTPDLTNSSYGISQEMLDKLCQNIAQVISMGIEVSIVVGGGNIYRGGQGSQKHSIDRASADYMGMLATVINGIAIQSSLERYNIPSRIMTAVPMPSICEAYVRYKALNHLKKKRVLVFAAGTGNPYFTTDTAAVLRATEMNCDLLLKATKVKGIYSDDPNKNDKAEFYSNLSYNDVKSKRLKVMDTTAITLAEENNMPIAVFSIYKENGFLDVLSQKGEYSLVA